MKLNQLTVAILAAGFAAQASASGFALSEQSISAVGTSNAGRASNAIDASVVYNNPAAMVNIKQAQVTAALAFIDAQTKIKNVTSPILALGATTEGDIVPHTFIPSGYFTSGDQGGWAWGIASYGSFGLKTNNEETFAGRHLGDKSSVKVTTIQPAISYRVNNKVSVGFGPTINYVDAFLSRAAPTNPANPATAIGSPRTAELSGDDLGYGYNIGVHLSPIESTQIGLVYRSKVKYKISDGGLEVKQGPTALAGTTRVNTGLTTPESLEASVSHKLTSATSLHAGATWTRWSRLIDLPVRANANGAVVSNEIFDWKDTMGYAVGVTHAYTDSLELRAGLAYDNSPVNPEHRSVRLPSNDRRIVSLGAGYKLTPTQTIDLSYTYLDEEKATVIQPAYSADYQNSASIYGVQFTQKF